ncbi:MAG: hypothetical protein AUK37_02100 [Rhodobacterales bacterium CG2_30_65_12]|nr:MAG: hypothetical protein AUK37_02100 [Rhodobacterales bacterium CG2_30_65_12]
MIRDCLTLGLGIGAILLATQGAARADDAACTERAALVERLAENYGESRQAAGLAGADRLVELFAAPETGSWTIIVTTPDGIACLYAAGEYFERFEGGPVAAGDPA